MPSAARALYQTLEVPATSEPTPEPKPPATASFHDSGRQHPFARRLVVVGLATVVVALAAIGVLGLQRGATVTRNARDNDGDEDTDTILLAAANKAEEHQKIAPLRASPIHLPAAHKIGISTSSAEGTWEIVYNGNVHVRSEKNMSSKVIGRKRHGDVVIGQREGDWLSLACEVGYLKIEIDGMPVVKERAQSYTLLSKGSCAEAGKRPVAGIFECEVAAASIGLSDIVATVSVDKSRPQGCYVDWDTEKLWLDTNPQNAGNGALGQYQPLCLDAVASRCAGGNKVPTEPADSYQTGKPAAPLFSASIFCFQVLTSQNEVEVDLVREQYKHHGGIFACDEWDLFADFSTTRVSPVEQEPGVYATRVPGPVLRGSNWTVWQNASAMLHVWSQIRSMDRYTQHDFVVKVEPDAVFVAQRLRINLLWYQKHQHLSKHEGVYFRNCVNFKSMEAAIEVFSRPAIDKFFDEQQTCLAGINKFTTPEEEFMSQCMDLLKMKTMYDWNLLSDYKCGDNPSKCDDKFKVVFHPFKDVGSMAFCLRKTIRER